MKEEIRVSRNAQERLHKERDVIEERS